MKVQIYQNINFEKMMFRKGKYPKEVIKQIMYLETQDIKDEIKKLRKKNEQR
jgi:protein-arginine kinase activator protein McsA